MWNKIRVKWQFTDWLCGNTPLDMQIWEKWYEKHLIDSVKPPAQKSIQEIVEDVYEGIIESGQALKKIAEDKTGLVGFASKNGVLCIGGYTVRSHIKDCATVLNRYIVGKIKGESSFASKIKNGIYVQDQWIEIRRESKAVSEPDGICEKPITVSGPAGRITTIKRFCYIERPEITYTLLCLASIHKTDLEKIFEYGAVHGFLGERSQEKGKYQFEILEM